MWPFELNTNSSQAVGLVAWWPMSASRSINGARNLSRALHLANIGVPTLGYDSHVGPVKQTTTSTALGVDSAPSVGTEITMMAWASYSLQTDYMPLISMAGSVGLTDRYTIYIAGNQVIDSCFAVATRGIDKTCQSVGPTGLGYTAGKFHLWAATFETSRRVAYLDGAPGTAETSSVVMSPLIKVRVGCEYYSGANQWGPSGSLRIADVRIYNRVLSNAEMQYAFHPAHRWDLYWQPQRRYYYALSQAIFQAAWAKRTNTLLGGGIN